MASENKQHKRAQRAKAKAKHVWNRAKDNMSHGESSTAAAEHRQGAAEQNQ